MKVFYLLLAAVVLSACSSYKTAIKEIESGNYAKSFDTSIKVLEKNSSSNKRKDKQLVVLQKAYLNANAQDEANLHALKSSERKDYRKIYYQTKSLFDRVNTIRRFLPLYKNGKELSFPTKDYTNELQIAKDRFLDQYYTAALDLMTTKEKLKARSAYEYLNEVKKTDRYYKDVVSKEQEAYEIGADVVNVQVSNKTGVPLPSDLNEFFLRDLNSAVNDFWTNIITHNSSTPRDFDVEMILRQAIVGNDILTTNTHHYEREVVDGWEYLKDKKGNIVKDSLGKPIKVDRYIRVQARVTEYFRQKEAMLSADIETYSYAKRSLIDSEPIAASFVFRSSFAVLDGDRRAIDPKHREILDLIQVRPMPFPNNYDMIAECSQELRRKLVEKLSRFN